MTMDYPTILNDLDFSDESLAPTDEELEALEDERLSDLDWDEYMESLA